MRAVGCDVVWLESLDPAMDPAEAAALVQALEERLDPYGLAGAVAVCSRTSEPLPTTVGTVALETAAEADLLLNMSYAAHGNALPLFRRTALLDIDPGLTQIWLGEGVLDMPEHDLYFTIGETVGTPRATFGDGSITWLYTPPCVALEWWPVTAADEGAPFTTVSGWQTRRDWVTHGEQSYDNSKRRGFEPYLELPKMTREHLELALCLWADENLVLAPHEEEERQRLEGFGWGFVHSYRVSSTPWDYRGYVQRSRGEFSCAKPSGVRLQNAWISDRTLCYLASGKPAVVEHTGPSSFLPDRAGIFRFRDLNEAAGCLEAVGSDYEHQCALARSLAEAHFDARVVCGRLLERALA